MTSSPAPVLDAWTPYDRWTWEQAGACLRGALQSLESAAAILTPLPAETQWESAGLTALHEGLLALRERAALALSSQRQRETEWDLATPA